MSNNYLGLLGLSSSRASLRNNTRASSGKSTGSKAKCSKSKKSSHSSLPVETVEYLKAWMMSPEHISHPYPTDAEKSKIMADTDIEIKQLTNWFVNNRKRFWKPRIEAAQKNGILPSQIYAGSNSALSRANTSPTRTSYTGNITSFGNLAAVPSAPVSVSDSSYSTYSSDDASVEGCDDVSSTRSSQASRTATFRPPVATISTFTAGCSTNMNCLPHDVYEDKDDEDSSSVITRHETVSVHILKPFEGEVPAIKDVTILSKVQQSDRILASFMNCNISYSFPAKVMGDRKKVQSRRDAEVVRIKKYYLRLFLASLSQEQQQVSSASVQPRSTIALNVGKTSPISAQNNIDLPDGNKRKASSSFGSYQVQHPISDKRHKQEIGIKQYQEWQKDSFDDPAKHNYVKMSPDTWKMACMSAKHGYCNSLPSLGEAAQMFGYSNQ